MNAGRNSWIWLAALCLFGFFHSALYALTNPVFESPDEPGHLEYVNRFAAGKPMPDQYREFLAEGHQPPLYYGSIGTLLRLAGGPISVHLLPSTEPGPAPLFDHRPDPFSAPRDKFLFYAIRLLGAAVVAVAVLQVGRASRQMMPIGHVWLVAPLLMAAWPQLAFIGSSISNDGLAAMLGACAAFAAARCATDPEKKSHWITLGIYVGLAFLSKKNALALAPAALLLLGAVRLYSPAAAKRALGYGLVAGVVAIALCLPVVVRNLNIYGDPMGHQMEMDTMPNLVYPQSLNSFHFRYIFPRVVPVSLVSQFGWMVVEVKSIFVWRFVWGVAFAAVLGLLALFDRFRGAFAVFCVTAVLANITGLVYYNLFFPQAQGRLLFPSLAALVLLCAMGLFEVSRRIRFRYKAYALLPIAVAMLWFDVLCFYTNQNFYAWFGERLGF